MVNCQGVDAKPTDTSCMPIPTVIKEVIGFMIELG